MSLTGPEPNFDPEVLPYGLRSCSVQTFTRLILDIRGKTNPIVAY